MADVALSKAELLDLIGEHAKTICNLVEKNIADGPVIDPKVIEFIGDNIRRLTQLHVILTLRK